MAQKSFHCKLVTPAAALVDDAVTYASVPASDGLMGFLPGRAPILAKLGVGELKLTLAEGAAATRTFVIAGGLVRMESDKMTILAESAVDAASISTADAEAELRAAKTPAAATFAKAKLQTAKSGH